MARRLVYLICIGCLLGLSSSVAVAAPTLSGNWSNHYKLRQGSGAYDHDLESTLTLDVGNASADRLSGSFLGGLLLDLNGVGTDRTFRGVYDSFSSTGVGRLYYAYLTANQLGPVAQLRFGRQHRFEFESLYFDGVHLESKPFAGVTAYAFGGVPVHQFENQMGFDWGDWLAGGALQWDPRANLRVRADYVYVKDSVSGFRAASGDQADHLMGASIWWDPKPYLSLASRFTSFSDDVRDVGGSVVFRLPDRQFHVRGDVYRLLKGYAFRVIELDAYGFSGLLVPYTEGTLTAHKGFGEHFAIDAGGGMRALDDTQAGSAFNHGYQRGFLSLTTTDAPIHGMSLTATGDYYHGADSTLKNNNFGGTFTVSQELADRKVRLSAGTAYYLYRYNVFAGDESADVQTVFARVRARMGKHLEARLGYEFEHNAVSNFHTVDTRVLWRF
ncbi:MAG: hypothetical protein HY696_08255 [Deltaproteobacteria bacterium]|nr:hypothetical protein [Deltaproteobacteria bacterium]